MYYQYYINQKKYNGITSVNTFYGYNKRKGCVGCRFQVFYSSKDPNKSSIRLGKYEKYKRTVEFVDLDKKNVGVGMPDYYDKSKQ